MRIKHLFTIIINYILFMVKLIADMNLNFDLRNKYISIFF